MRKFTSEFTNFVSEGLVWDPIYSDVESTGLRTIPSLKTLTNTVSQKTIETTLRMEAPAPVIDLSTLSAAQGFIVQGDIDFDHAGYSVSNAGDVNGDGFDDLIMGAPAGDDGGTGAGEAYVVFGTDQGFGTDVAGRHVLDLSHISAVQGFIIQGDTHFDRAGTSVSNAGDINGDGYDDLIVGARLGDDGGPNAGEAYIVFGTDQGFGTDVAGRQVLDLSHISATQGFIIQGDTDGNRAGQSVSSAGDVNGDGFDDLIVGAPLGDDGGGDAGEAYVVFGTDQGFGTDVAGRQVLDLSYLSATQGFIIQGDTDSDEAGWSVSSAGDVNGDGYDDLIVGAYIGDDGGTGAGEAYVMFGTDQGFGTDVAGRQVINLSHLSVTQGFIIQGDADDDFAGVSVSNAGDVNGDGFDDIIVGASGGDDGGSGAGEAYVVYGTDQSFGDTVAGRQVIDLTNLSPSTGFIIQGDVNNNFLGVSASYAGDVNGDGFDDIIVGASGGDDGGSGAGEAYVLFGTDTGFGGIVSGRQVVNTTTLSSAQGFVIQGDNNGDSFGGSVSSGGDINGDGFDDLIVGASNGQDGGVQTGEAYVVFGTDQGFGDSVNGRQIVDLTSLSNEQGFIIQGGAIGDGAGNSVSFAGDVNGDGFGDVIVGAANGNDGATRSGQAYVLFGTDSGFGVDVNGRQVIHLSTLSSAQGFVIQGGDQNDYAGTSVASAGDVNGDGFDDVLVGARDFADVGKTYVIYGSAQLFGDALNDRQIIDLGSLTSMQGFVIEGNFDGVGRSVSSAGDINGDGYDDLVLGASLGNGNLPGVSIQSGETYIIYGGATGTESTVVETHAGTAGTDNFTGNAGDDTFTGIGTNDVVRGGAGNDTVGITGATFADLDGGNGIDTLALEGADIALDLENLLFLGLDSFEVIDLTGSGDNSLTVDRLSVQNLTSVRDAGRTVLTINGDAGDNVFFTEAWNDGGTTQINSVTYNLFENGNVTLQVEQSVLAMEAPATVIDLATLTAAQGFVILGDQDLEYAGRSVSDAGDINGDGFADIIIGARDGDDGGQNAGEAYVIYGTDHGFGANVSGRQILDVLNLFPNEGFIIQGTANAFTGISVSSAGDINNDGYADIMVNVATETYVFFGTPEVFGSSMSGRQVFDVASFTGADGFILNGGTQGTNSKTMSSAGDVNGDGLDDIIVGHLFGDLRGRNVGESYVIFGTNQGFVPNGGARPVLDLANLTAAQGFIIAGDNTSDTFGISVSSAGDINGDGFDDLIAGAAAGDDGGENAGEAYVIFGTDQGFGSSSAGQALINLSSFNASQGFILQGDSPRDLAGRAVSSAGDINGDGFMDVIVGAPDGDDGGRTNAGEAYVVFGSDQGFGVNVSGRQVVDLTSLSSSQGFIIQGNASFGNLGASISSAGDINGDGYDDLIVGNPNGDNGGNNSGEAYVIYGTNRGFGESVSGRQVINVSNLSASEGFVIQGESGVRAGFSVSSAGDVNRDGYDDLLVGTQFGGISSRPGAGTSYIIYGGATGTESTVAETHAGTAGMDNFMGNAGNDTFTSVGANDVVRGGAGDDVISLSSLGFFDIDGGHGNDTLGLEGAGITLDLTTLANPRLSSIETIDLTGSGDNTLVLNAREVLNLTDLRRVDSSVANGDSFLTLTIKGDAGDVIDLQGNWTQTQVIAFEGIVYNVYRDGNAFIRVQETVALANVTVTGTNVDDILTAGSGNDTIFGMDGNDFLIGLAGADVLDGGAGRDTADYRDSGAGVTVNLLTNTATGSDAQGDTFVSIESVYGSQFGDTITGDTGNNTVFAFGGDDTVNGGDGVDDLHGGAGADTLNGGEGNDRLLGGEGADVLDGGNGNDIVDYRDSTAEVIVDLGTGTGMGGYAQGDMLSNFERLFGSQFGDMLTGDGGANVIRGFSGSDTLSGGDGNDRLIGGLDADSLNGGTGRDVASYRDATARVVVNLATGGTEGEAQGDTYTSIEDIHGSAFSDVLTGDGGDNTIYGFEGADTINGGAGTDRIIGGDGDDIIDGGAGRDVLFGDAGTDTASYASATTFVSVSLAINGAQETFGAGVDTLIGFENLTGGLGNDTLIGDGNDNVLSGGAGNDRLEGGAGSDTLNGGAGSDTAVYRTAAALVSINLGTSTMQGAAAGDTYISIESVEGSAFNDFIIGDGGANTLTGLDGADRLYGAGGDDILVGGNGADRLRGGDGADQMDGGAGTDTVDYRDSTAGVTVNLATNMTSGGFAAGDMITGFEWIFGSEFGDTLTGDGGDNTIYGFGGTDTINGGGGVDRLVSGDGNDTLNGDAGDDVLLGGEGADVLNGGAGRDIADYRDSTAAVNVNLGANSASGGAAQGDTFISIERLFGSQFGDILTGDGLDNELRGFEGNDNMNGGAGDDYMIGGSGADTMIGGSGNDLIIGGADADVMIGGSGADTFLFTAASASTSAGRDLITDFSGSGGQGDRIYLDDFLADTAVYTAGGAFTGVGNEIISEIINGDTLVSVDVDGDNTADFELLLSGIHALTIDDFFV